MRNRITQFIDEHADQGGVLVSIVCIIHCLAIPLMLIFSPTLAMYFEHEIIHVVIIAMVIPLVLTSLTHLKAGKGHRYILFLGPIGVALIIFATAYEFLSHDKVTLAGEMISIFGSILLVIFHWHNLKVRKMEATCCKTDTVH